jgi:hypothetical protein
MCNFSARTDVVVNLANRFAGKRLRSMRRMPTTQTRDFLSLAKAIRDAKHASRYDMPAANILRNHRRKTARYG